MNQLTNEQLAYIAGIVDGEGCISITKLSPQRGCVTRDYKGRVHITNTDKRLIDWLIETVGTGHVSIVKQKNPKWNTRYDWVLHRGQVVEFLRATLPFLVLKQGEAQTMLEFISTFTNRSGQRVSDEIVSIREKCYQSLLEAHS